MPNKAYKFRLYPTPAQKILLAKTFGCPACLQPLARSEDQPVQRRPDDLELYFLCQRTDRNEEK
ncbi:hypothetical protein EROP_23960 [Erysipelotrichaceae bacterium OPF54]|nr:hypothetical protein EROP_22500 [Erysipelotrichaceae bacterium OPF54]GJM58630.1 hypothetical protein EROP_23230 [Erysipelotrichaceae bacterium OPF54]GJM58703.1 hypothetical protein EROP_23960 [Erysipelotrichaceae bacterium OPF54]